MRATGGGGRGGSLKEAKAPACGERGEPVKDRLGGEDECCAATNEPDGERGDSLRAIGGAGAE